MNRNTKVNPNRTEGLAKSATPYFVNREDSLYIVGFSVRQKISMANFDSITIILNKPFQSVCLSFSLSVACLPVCLSVSLFFVPVCPSVCLSVFLCVCLSVCLSIPPSVSPILSLFIFYMVLMFFFRKKTEMKWSFEAFPSKLVADPFLQIIIKNIWVFPMQMLFDMPSSMFVRGGQPPSISSQFQKCLNLIQGGESAFFLNV